MAGILRLVNDGGGSQTQLTASGSTDRNIALPDADGVLVVEPTSSGGGTGAYLARNASASEAERTAAGEIIFSNNISVAGTSAFTGLTTHAGGVKVTGGSPAGVVDGISKQGTTVQINADSSPIIQLNQNVSYKLSLSPDVDSVNSTYGYGCVFSPRITNSTFTTAAYAMRCQPGLTGLTTPIFSYYNAALTYSPPPSAVDNVYAFHAEGAVAFGADKSIGFRSDFALDGDRNYNFYAAGTAPNYFAGDTFIGGTTAAPNISLFNDGSSEFNDLAHFKTSVQINNNLCVNVGTAAAKARVHIRHGSQSVLRGVNTTQFGSSNVDLIGGRNSSSVGAGFGADVGALNFYNHRGYSGTSDRDDNAKKIAGVHAYSQSNDVKASAAGILSFAVSPDGIDPATGEVYTPKDFLSINQNGTVLVSDWYDTSKFAFYFNTKDDTNVVRLQTNSKETIALQSSIGLGKIAGDKRNVVEFKVPNNSNGQATQSILIGSKRISDGNTANQSHNFIQGGTGKLVFNHGTTGTTRFYGIDNSTGTEVENLAYTISKDGSMKIENMTTFNLQMESDDPAAFQTTYSTDEEGNQVENQTYIGTTEDLLSIIRDLRSRVDALEAQLNP